MRCDWATGRDCWHLRRHNEKTVRDLWDVRSGESGKHQGNETHQPGCNTKAELNTGEVQIIGQTGDLRIAYNDRE